MKDLNCLYVSSLYTNKNKSANRFVITYLFTERKHNNNNTTLAHICPRFFPDAPYTHDKWKCMLHTAYTTPIRSHSETDKNGTHTITIYIKGKFE